MTVSVCLAVTPSYLWVQNLSEILAFAGAVALWTIASHGVNQIYDLEVDRVNKPHFPLPSGSLSLSQAWFASIGTGIVGSLLALQVLSFVTGFLLIAIMTAATIVYCVPWFNVRGNAWLPKIITVAMRGGFFPTISYIGAGEFTQGTGGNPTHLGFLLSFAILFCIGMNTFEDILDIEGDRLNGYASFAQRLGPVRTAYICLAAFTLAYICLILWQVWSPHFFRGDLGILACSVLLVLFCFRFRHLVYRMRQDINAAKPFYLFLWQLYCAQYLLLPVLFKHP